MYCITQTDKKNKVYLSLLENIRYYYKHQYFLQIKKGDLGESPMQLQFPSPYPCGNYCAHPHGKLFAVKC